jgi:hypothetical protein
LKIVGVDGDKVHAGIYLVARCSGEAIGCAIVSSNQTGSYGVQGNASVSFDLIGCRMLNHGVQAVIAAEANCTIKLIGCLIRDANLDGAGSAALLAVLGATIERSLTTFIGSMAIESGAGKFVTTATLTGSETLTGKTFNAASGVNTFQLNGNTVNNYSGAGPTVLLALNPQIAGSLRLEGSTSQVALLQAAAVAGNCTLTVPSITDTLVGRTTIDTLSGKTLMAPKIVSGGFIADANGNEQIIFVTAASAVNEVTYANAATGANPKLSATGGDGNIGLDFQVKGTGTYRFLATSSGPTDIRLFEDADNGTNYISLIAPASMAADRVLTLPNATDTLVGRDTIDTLTGKTFNAASGVNTLQFNGNTVNNFSGSGSTVLLSTSPQLAGALRLEGASSQVALLQATAVAGNVTLTLPAATGTVAVTKDLGLLRVILMGVNFNSANTDNAIAITLPSGVSRWVCFRAFISNASASISTATAGVFTAAGGGGQTIAATQALTVTTASASTNNNSMSLTITNANTEAYTETTAYFRVVNPQGSAATADVILDIHPLT